MKDYSHIEDLLERYYNAQTSEAEERRLKDFFLHEEVPAHLQAEKEMFMQLLASDVPEGLEGRLEQSIDRWEMQERHTVKKHRTILLRWVGSIAASFLLLFGVGWYLQDSPRRDTCATPEEAYAEAQKALVMFSVALNKGMDQMDIIQETAGKAERNFYEQLNKLNNTGL